MKLDSYDASVVGGALTGTVLYLALADIFIKHNKSLVILEQSTQPPADNRMLSLGYAGAQYLKEFGLWDEIEPHACPVTAVSISYREGHNFTVNSTDIGLSALGWTIPHSKLQQILWQKINDYATKHESLHVITPFTMDSFDITQSPALIKGDSNGGEGEDSSRQDIYSKLIFMATGASSLAKNSKIINYHQYNTIDTCPKFTVASVKFKQASQEPYQPDQHKRGKEGYWFYRNTTQGNLTLALTPNSDEVYTAILSRSCATRGKATKLDASSFINTINTIGGMEIKVTELIDEPLAYPGISYLAEERVKGPLVLVGNAAHSVAPLGGQNYNLTLWTISKLRGMLAIHLAKVRGINQRQFLADFVTATESKLKKHIAVVHWVDRELSRFIKSGGTSTRLLDACLDIASTTDPIRKKLFLWATGVNRR